MPVIREQARPLGVVYTPQEVAGPMVRLALTPAVAGKSAAEILALRVCDPASGAGAFLVEVVSFLADHLVAAWARDATGAPSARTTWTDEARRLVARQCIAGIDVDAHAVGLARQLCVTGRDESAVGSTIRCGDALSLDWAAAYPDVFARGGFDVIVANPPYIRQERLGRKARLEPFASYDGVADLYVYFIELAHRLLRPGGRYCVIVPNKWLTVAYGRGLRAFLAKEASVEGVLDVSRAGVFQDADAFSCIVWGSVGDHRTASDSIRALRLDGEATVEEALAAALDATHTSTTAATRDLATTARDAAMPVTGESTIGESSTREATTRESATRESVEVSSEAAALFSSIDRSRWTADPWHIDSSNDYALIDRLERTHRCLGDLIGARWSRGVVTGLNRAFVVDRAIRDRLIASEPAAAALLRPFVKGRDVRPWATAPIERWILLVDRGTSLDELPGVLAHLQQFREALEPRPADWSERWSGRKPGRYAWYELQDPVVPLAKSRTPRLFYQDIQTAPACSLDREGALVPDTTVWILPSADRFLLALLNSPLFGWYARRRFPPALNGAVRPKLEYMRRLPIAVPTADLRREIESAVEARLAASHENTDQLDRTIAARVAEAYELSERERSMIANS